MPANRYMSPSSFRSLPPANPLSGAEVYLVPVDALCGPGEPAAVEASDTDEEDRVNGLVIAVDRRNGFEDAGTGAGGGAGEIELVGIGGNEGGPTDVGLPPGVSARVRDMPIPLWPDSVSTECEWGIATVVAFLDLEVSIVGVAELV